MASTTYREQAIKKSQGSFRVALNPLPIWGSLIAFGLPALMMVFSYHAFMPWLRGGGLVAAESFVVAHVAPMAVMLAVALAVFHHWEGRPQTWAVWAD